MTVRWTLQVFVTNTCHRLRQVDEGVGGYILMQVRTMTIGG
jgi:hypothetical protein